MRVRLQNGREIEVRDVIAERMVAKGCCSAVERDVTPGAKYGPALPAVKLESAAGGVQPDRPWPKPLARVSKGKRK